MQTGNETLALQGKGFRNETFDFSIAEILDGSAQCLTIDTNTTDAQIRIPQKNTVML